MAEILGRRTLSLLEKIDTSKPKYYVLDMFPYPSRRRPARRPSRRLHGDRHRRALQAHARLQRAAPDGLGRVRPAGGAVRDQDRHASAHHDASSNVERFRAPAPVARLLLRLGARGRHDRPGLLQVDAVDLPASSSSAGSRIRRRCPVNWCPALGTALANEEVIDGKSEVGGFPSCAGRCGSGCCASPRTPSGCSTISTTSTGPSRMKEMQRNWIGTSEGAEVDFAVDGPTATSAHASSRRGPTRCSARRTWCSRPSIRWSIEVTTPERSARRSRRIAKPRRRKSDLERTELTQGQDRRLHRRVRDQPGRTDERRSRSGSPTTCSWATAPARSWPCPAHDERDYEFAQAIRPADRSGRCEPPPASFDGDERVHRRRHRRSTAASSTA